MADFNQGTVDSQRGVADPRQGLGVWPVHLTIAGAIGWTLWFEGTPDVLLAQAGAVVLFASPEVLIEAVTTQPARFTPVAIAGIDGVTLTSMFALPAATIDFDATEAWFAGPEREVSVKACDRALTALNMAVDIGATAGDRSLAALVASPVLAGVHDSLTFGVTMLGDGGPFRDDARAMIDVLSPEATAGVSKLFAMARSHVEVM